MGQQESVNVHYLIARDTLDAARQQDTHNTVSLLWVSAGKLVDERLISGRRIDSSTR